MSAPTVLVNLTWLVPGVVGGSEESTTDALRAVLEQAPTDLRLRLAVLRPFLEAHPDLAGSLPCEVLALDGSDKRRRVLAEQTWLAATTRRVGAAVVHHAGGVVPLVHPGRVVLTIHDLQPLDLAQNFSFAKRTYVRAMVGRSARAATVVCVPSEFTRSRVVELLGVDRDDVAVVPWSVPDHVRAPAQRGPGGADGSGDAAGEPVSMPAGPYLLYPAITYAHKNHLVLLEAFARVAATHPELSLVLTGGEGPLESRVLERVAQLGLARRVVRPGRVPQGELAELYRHAVAVVVPSRYEGFGLPALEAMARGCPVIASRAGSLPEFVPAADLVDPDDVTAWAAAMQAVVSLRGTEREDRIAAGRAAAGAFTPGRTAEALLGAYRRALAAGPGSPRT